MCGCSATTSTCDDGSSFTISSTVMSDGSGCYSDTGSVKESETIYSETGTVEGQQNIMFAFDFGQNDTTDVSGMTR